MRQKKWQDGLRFSVIGQKKWRDGLRFSVIGQKQIGWNIWNEEK